jgi:hypothetical protein
MTAARRILSIPRALLRHAQAAMLRWSISSTEQYMAAATRDGILDSHTLRHWRLQMQADRVRLARLEAVMHPVQQHQPEHTA